MFFSSTLLALVLTLPDAEAGDGKRARHIGLLPFVTDKAKRVSVILPPGEATAVSAELSSDAGSETLDLVESNAWLHGAATIKTLPTADADLRLTVYDRGSASLITFSGTLGADGAVALTLGSDKLDIEVLAAQVFPNADGGYDIGFDLGGADAYTIAYADVAITEGKTGTKAEVDLDAIGAVWEGEPTLDHEGLVELETKTYDVDGNKLESSKVKLGIPWDDGGYGVNTLATDDDPLTRVALTTTGTTTCEHGTYFGADCSALVVVSTDWTSSAAPVSATIELDGGETLAVPANSYQVAAATPITFSGAPEKEVFQVAINGTAVKLGSRFGDRGLCADGTCVALTQAADGTWTLSATAYAVAAAKLPTSVKVSLTSTLKAASTRESSYSLGFDPEVAVVFASGVSVPEDPIGVDLSGKVSLLDAANDKGKQKTLAKGTFYGAFTRDEDGDLALGGVDKDTIDAKGDILIGGEPIDFELTDTNKDGVIEAPPVIVYKADSNGKGTRVVATSNNGNPGLL